MNRALVNLILDTPLETPLRWLYTQLSPCQAATYDRETMRVMDRAIFPAANAVDIGCHRGAILREILKRSPNGTHFAFEPIPDLYRALTRTFPRVQVFDVALSSKPGVSRFQHVISWPGYSGFKRLDYPGRETILEIEVRTDALDNIIPVETPIHFVKIDVEGAELEVLQGAVQTLRRYQPVVVFEHGCGAVDHYGTTPAAVYDLLKNDCGLSVSLMKMWLDRKPAFSKTTFVEQVERGLAYYFIAYPEKK